ncbi:MAG: DUF2344 domain-containing protein [Dehalococcoidia bacterium]|nr:DUF2344 domain-containing protein [Dehalococcoidia bacterium]
MQRLRLRFGRGVDVRFISHLDMMRCWERVFRRADIPIEYTQGFTPHPRLAAAAPLAVGFTGSGELLDVWLRKWTPPDAVMMMVQLQLPRGFEVSNVQEVPVGAPSLQSILTSARYSCVARHPEAPDIVHQAVQDFLNADSIICEYQRRDKVHSQDIRPLVNSLVVEEAEGGTYRIELSVRLAQDGSVRPEHVLASLGFSQPADSIHRVSLSWET